MIWNIYHQRRVSIRRTHIDQPIVWYARIIAIRTKLTSEALSGNIRTPSPEGSADLNEYSKQSSHLNDSGRPQNSRSLTISKPRDNPLGPICTMLSIRSTTNLDDFKDRIHDMYIIKNWSLREVMDNLARSGIHVSYVSQTRSAISHRLTQVW